MENLTKADIKSAFKSARELMRYIENNLSKWEDFDEAGQFGQAVLELIAEVSIVDQYRVEKYYEARV